MHTHSTASPLDSDADTTLLSRFHLFLQLPIELRLKIWGFSTLHPRLIEIEYGGSSCYGHDDEQVYTPINTNHDLLRVSSRPRKPLAVFKVNREARYEALEYYEETAFDDPSYKSNSSSPQLKFDRPLYFNPQSDIFCFSSESLYGTQKVFRRRFVEYQLKSVGSVIELRREGRQFLVQEIGLFGTKMEIEKAQIAIKEEMMSIESRDSVMGE